MPTHTEHKKLPARWTGNPAATTAATTTTITTTLLLFSGALNPTHLLYTLASSISKSAFCRLMRSSMLSFISCDVKTRSSSRAQGSDFNQPPPYDREKE